MTFGMSSYPFNNNRKIVYWATSVWIDSVCKFNMDVLSDISPLVSYVRDQKCTPFRPNHLAVDEQQSRHHLTEEHGTLNQSKWKLQKGIDLVVIKVHYLLGFRVFNFFRGEKIPVSIEASCCLLLIINEYTICGVGVDDKSINMC